MDCSRVLEINAELAVKRGRGSVPVRGQLVMGEQAAHVFCPQAVLFLIQCLVAEGVSPAPSRQVVAKHAPEWFWRARCQAWRKVLATPCILGAPAISVLHHPVSVEFHRLGCWGSGCVVTVGAALISRPVCSRAP